ncbi:hypothetical protein CXU15_03580 [Akkermansia muciniphila]|nr:hypothetical protein CXU15_03580 [Akkermansia muciniphila]
MFSYLPRLLQAANSGLRPTGLESPGTVGNGALPPSLFRRDFCTPECPVFHRFRIRNPAFFPKAGAGTAKRRFLPVHAHFFPASGNSAAF